MSQQGPGGYGGGGPYGPPGGGYPPGGGPPGGGYPPGGGPPGGGYPPGGPPGGGGYPPPGGYPPGGAPPGGYGPPGYGPPGAPPGYGPPQQGYGGYPGGPPGGPPGPPQKKSKALLFVGLGCGALILLGIAGSVGSYFYMKSKVNDAETAIANLAADAGALAAPAAGSVSATCAKTIACCKAITEKSAGPSNTALVDQACNGIGLLSDAQCLQQYNALKTSAAAVHATCE